MKMNKKLGAALALSMVVGATTTVPVMAETTNNPGKTTNDTTKSATDLRKEANTAKAEYDKAAAASKKADQELAAAQKDKTNAEKTYNAAKTAKEKFEAWQTEKTALYNAAKATEDAMNKVDSERLTQYNNAKKALEDKKDDLENAYDKIVTTEKEKNLTPTYFKYLQLSADKDEKNKKFADLCTNNHLVEDGEDIYKIDENTIDKDYRALFVSFRNASVAANEAYGEAVKQFTKNRNDNKDYDDAIDDVKTLPGQITEKENEINTLVNNNEDLQTYTNKLNAEKVADEAEDKAHEEYSNAKKAYGKSFDSQPKWEKEVGRVEKVLGKANDVLTEKTNAANEAKKAATALKTAYDNAEQSAVAAEKAEEALRLAEEARKAAEAKPDKVTLNKATSKKKKTVKVTWEKANAAKTYEVAYRRKKKAKKWTKWTYKVVKGTSYTNKKLKSKKTYQFKVRGLNGKIKGAFSSKKKVTVK